MKPSEEIRAQREFLLANEYVHTYPLPGQGCLIVRRQAAGSPFVNCGELGGRSRALLREALDVLHPNRDYFGESDWNDRERPTLDQALEVLEYGEKLAKIEEGEE